MIIIVVMDVIQAKKLMMNKIDYIMKSVDMQSQIEVSSLT